jgi:hypothetical protein
MDIPKSLKIQEFEKDRKDFTSCGLDIVGFVRRKRMENPKLRLEFKDYAGDYYKAPEHFYIGNDLVYKKKQFAGEVPAEVILAYAYNYLGIPSSIAYPFYMSTYIPNYNGTATIADGVVTKDITQVFPTAEKRGDRACHTIKGLYTDEKCNDITAEGKLSRVKETIASIAFNNKDAGFDNSFWVYNPKTKMYESVVSIDHGYSGRDSMYGSTKEQVLRGLYFKGEHGYNGMYDIEEDRATILHYLRKLLNGERVDGVQFNEHELKDLHAFINAISKLDFEKIANDYKSRYKFVTSPKFLSGLEYSREDCCEELSR